MIGLKKSKVWILLVLLTYNSTLWGQNTVTLSNPSFEDLPRHSRPPVAWTDCGFMGETPPDIQPNATFKVTRQAKDGDTYLGMVVRENDTWEAVGQRLSEPMKKGNCYEFSIYLAKSEMYVSLSREEENKRVNYITPAKLRIYGGYEYCDKDYLLGETQEIANSTWIRYDFKFEPLGDYTHIILEAFYKTPTLFPYNGNILVDHASPIVPVPCQPNTQIVEAPEEEIPQQIKEDETAETVITELEEEKNVVPSQPKTNPTNITSKEKVAQEKTTISSANLSKVKASQLSEGQTIKLDNLYFEMDKSILTDNSENTLLELFEFLNNNQKVIIEVGGHTNGLCSAEYCDELSRERAKAVASSLVKMGLPGYRILYKGYGKRMPIATNETIEGRTLNQRVEIKIISLGE
jgi:outer membrane protein OmpA-like peptidoglycan-associated protein